VQASGKIAHASGKLAEHVGSVASSLIPEVHSGCAADLPTRYLLSPSVCRSQKS
jgi:hypothetical protein